MSLWWNHKYGKYSLCGISRGRIRPGYDKQGYSFAVKLPCGHCFYRKAIIEWSNKFEIYNNNFPTCPICRIEFYIKE